MLQHPALPTVNNDVYAVQMICTAEKSRCTQLLPIHDVTSTTNMQQQLVVNNCMQTSKHKYTNPTLLAAAKPA
jgi:hypothetical protein